jgi:hypothetical protein
MRAEKGRDSNCSFCTGVSPYTVHVGISVAKAGWDSAGDDVVPMSVTVQQQPLAAVPQLSLSFNETRNRVVMVW